MPNKWQTILDELKNIISPMAFDTYFNKAKFVSDENKVLTFSVQSAFVKSSIEKKYHDKIMSALKAAGFNDESFEIIVVDQPKKSGEIRQGIEIIPGVTPERGGTKVSSVGDTLKKMTSSIANNGLNSNYRLDNYVVGGNNDVAVGAARAIIDNPGNSYNPLFLYGGSGYGKTHLIQAIGNEIHNKYPDMNILYVTTEQIVSEFVSSIQNKKLENFKQKYRDLDVLIVDDFQFIQGKTESQNEFFNIFNYLHSNNKQVIVTADRLPSQIATVDPRLSSRLTQGISIDIQLPDFETRCAIIREKAKLKGNDIDNTTVEYLAENFNTNIRDLESGLNHVLLLADLRGVPTSEVIGEITPINQPAQRRVSPRQVIDKVAKYYNLNIKDLLGTSRVKDIKNARQVAMYLMNEELGLSTPKIGDEFQKDHTTIMHGVRVVKKNLKTDFNLREQITELRSKIYAN